MKKILMSVLGLMLMFTAASVLSAADDQKPPKAKIEDIKKKMTDEQAKQFDQLRAAEKAAAKAYKEGKTAENEQKLKDAITATIEFTNQVFGTTSTNIDELVNKRFKKMTEESPKKGDKKQ